jgi:hypothetical protein
VQRRQFITTLAASGAAIALDVCPQLFSESAQASIDQSPTPAQLKPRYENWYRCFVIDLAAPDPPIVTLSKLDEAQISNYERMLQVARIDNTFVYCKDHWGNAYYNTKVGKKHGGLRIDYVGQMSSVLRRNNIGFVAYYSVGLDNDAALRHPDWAVLDEDGTKRRITAQPPTKFYWCCLNSPYRQFLLEQIREIVGGYKPDAIFLDLFGQSLCYCQHCQRQFRTFSGMVEIPRGRNIALHRALLNDFVYRTLYLEPFKEIAGLSRSVNPDTAVALPGGYAFHRREMVAISDFIVFEPFRVFQRFPMKEKQWEYFTNELVPSLHDNLLSGIFCRGLGKSPQLVPGFESLVFDPQHPNVTEAAVAQMLASGCRGALYSDCQHVDGTLDQYQFEVLGKVYREVERFQKLLPGRESVKGVGLVYSEATRLNGPGESFFRSVIGALVAGAYSLYPFDVIPEWEINQQVLEQFQVLVLSDVSCLSPDTVGVLKEYVARGGNLIATMRTSVMDQNGKQLSDFQLADLFGCNFRRVNEQYSPNEWGSFLRREGENSIWNGLPPTELGMSPPLVEVVASKGTVIAWHLLPATVTSSESWINWWSPQPRRETSPFPAIIRNSHGKGKVVYCSFDLFGMLEKSFLWPKDFFLNLLKDLAPRPLLKVVSANHGVLAATYFRRSSDGSLLIHLLNLSVWQLAGRVIPVAAGELIVNDNRFSPNACRLLYPEPRELPLSKSGNDTVVRLPEVNIHSIVELK